MRAAIAAAEQGCNVGVVCKSLLGKAHTVMAEGGIAAALGNVDAEDSWEVHFGDTLRGGAMLNSWRMVELYSHEVIDRVLELEQWVVSSIAPSRAGSASGPLEPIPGGGWLTSVIAPGWS